MPCKNEFLNFFNVLLNELFVDFILQSQFLVRKKHNLKKWRRNHSFQAQKTKYLSTSALYLVNSDTGHSSKLVILIVSVTFSYWKYRSTYFWFAFIIFVLIKMTHGTFWQNKKTSGLLLVHNCPLTLCDIYLSNSWMFLQYFQSLPFTKRFIFILYGSDQ